MSDNEPTDTPQPASADSAEEPTEKPTTEQLLGDLQGQSAMMRHQLGQVNDAVRQLWDAVGAQCRQVDETRKGLEAELQRFQTNGGQRAMSAIYFKMMRDLAGTITELDRIVGAVEEEELDDTGLAWLDSLRIFRDQFESVLASWGCKPMPIEVGKDSFSPETHHAIEAEDGDIPEGMEPHLIAAVKKRGWTMMDEVVQHPEVVVS